MGGRISKDKELSINREGLIQQYLDQIKEQAGNYQDDINVSYANKNAKDCAGVGTITIACSSEDAEDRIEDLLKQVKNSSFSGDLQSSTFSWTKKGSANEVTNENSIYTIKSGDSSFMLMLYLEAIKKSEDEKKQERSSSPRAFST